MMPKEFKDIQETLRTDGIDSSYCLFEDEHILCWYSKENIRVSVSVWEDDYDYFFLCAVKNGDYRENAGRRDNILELVEGMLWRIENNEH